MNQFKNELKSIIAKHEKIANNSYAIEGVMSKLSYSKFIDALHELEELVDSNNLVVDPFEEGNNE